MREMDQKTKAGVEICLNCYKTCFTHAMMSAGAIGGHVTPPHFELLMACSSICKTSADLMIIGTEYYKRTCLECAQICRECAARCSKVTGMEECADACTQCATSCEQIAA